MKNKEKVSKMAENKLPSGVGKKIVEALKKQAEIEIQPIPEPIEPQVSAPREAQPVSSPSQELYTGGITDNISLDDNFSDFSVPENNDADDFSGFGEETVNESSLTDDLSSGFGESFAAGLNFEETSTPMFEEKEIFNSTPAIKGVPPQKSYAMPANVAVLKRLIMQLPQGVTKQTGAQIIRQTMEALGISMNSVLKEAQQGQDSLTASAKACMATIAEYQSNIKTLEKQVQDYKKQAIALNDLISLFVMTDKH